MRRAGTILWIGGSCLLLAAGCGGMVWAGQPPGPVSVQAVSRAGLGRYRPGRWGIVTAQATNRSDQPAEAMATVYVAGQSRHQYARRMWLPPRSYRRSWCPLKMPDIPRRYGAVEVVSLAVGYQGGMEVLWEDASGNRRPSGLLPLDHVRGTTASVGHRRLSSPFGEEPEATEEVRRLVQAFNEAGGLPMIVLGLGGKFLVPIPEALDGLDYLVVAGDQLATDAAALRAVRQWLLGGRTLWVTLDRVSPHTVELLLGDVFDCQVVDRVGLTSVEIQDGKTGEPVGDEGPQEYEDPVEMVRVVTSGAEVIYRVNGWPAALLYRAGRGRVFITTLGPRGWLRRRQADEPPPLRAPYYPPWTATGALLQLAYRMVQPPSVTPELEPHSLAPFLSEQIGYRILPRGTVLSTLGGFCVVVGLAALWLRRRGRAERLIWVVPLLATVAAAALVALGARSRQAVPPTVAMGQVVYVEPGMGVAEASGLMALYNQKAHRGPLGARRGGLFDPDLSGGEMRTRRMVWTDLDAWHWENVTLPPGVRMASFRQTIRLDQPVDCRARFDAEGLMGTLVPGPLGGASDPVLVLPGGGTMAPRLAEDGRFVAGPAEVLARGQFIGAELLDDRQRRRQVVYGRLLTDRTLRRTDRPLLLFWAPPLDLGFRLPEDARQTGSALVMVPLRIEPSAPGTRVRVPSACLPFRCVEGLETHRSAAYNNQHGEWLECRTPSRVWLRFQVPQSVLPLAVEEATLTVRIEAPEREVELQAVAEGQARTLVRRESPMESIQVEVDEPGLLRLDADGGLILGIVVGQQKTEGPVLTVDGKGSLPWRIEHVALELVGTVLAGPSVEVARTGRRGTR